MSDAGFQLPPIDALVDLHAETLAAHGGAPGLRDRGALEAALARPLQLLAYGTEPATVEALATALCVSIIRNHPFVDGNKRIGFLALVVTLGLHGLDLDVGQREAAAAITALAAGEATETDLLRWVQRFTHPLTPETGS